MDFEGDPTLVLIAFQCQQRSVLDAWHEFAAELSEEFDDFEYAELYVAGGHSGMGLPAMTGGLAPTPGTPSLDDRTLVARVDRRSFRRSLGLPGEQTIYALLVDDEYVVRQAAGMFTRDVAEVLRSLLSEWEAAQARWTEARVSPADAESSAGE